MIRLNDKELLCSYLIGPEVILRLVSVNSKTTIGPFVYLCCL